MLRTTLPDPDGSGPLASPTTSSTYDSLGRKISDTNAMHQTRSFAYNADGQLASVTLPAVSNPQNGGATANPAYQYGYDAFGHQTSIQDPLGRVTQFAFDERGNELSRTLPLGVEHGGFAETFQYDDLGRQTLHVSFEGAVTQSIYDPQTGRLSEERFFGNLTDYNDGAGTPNETWTYTYDAFDRMVSVTQTGGTTTSTTITTYDENGRVASIASPRGVLHYEYDPATGLKTRTYTTDPNNPSTVLNDTRYTYDVLGRLLTVEVVEQNGVTLSTPQTTTDEYDLTGNLREQIDPNGSLVDYVYNNLNELTEETQYAPDGATKIAEYDYTLEADGKRTAATETFWWNVGGIDTPHVNNLTWSYDSDGRLTDEVLASYDPTLSYADHYTLDLVGNRLSETKNWSSKPAETITNFYDDNDRLLSSTDAPAGGTATTTTYGYGPGNAWTVETGEMAVTGTVTTRSVAYSYNLQGELSVATVKTYDSSTGALTSDQQTTYSYDASGIRVSALVQTDTALNGTYDMSVLTEYLNDPNNPTGYSQVLQETTTNPSTGQVQKVVVYTIGSTLISQTTTLYANNVPGTAQTLVFGYDGHGSVRVLLDMTAAIATVASIPQLFHYDAYGNLLNLSAAQAATSILYSGQMLDGGTALYYNRARWYDSQTGRFNSLDPFFGDLQDPQSLHRYLYVNSDPVNTIDPSGEFGASLIGVMVSAGIRSGLISGGVGALFRVPALVHNVLAGEELSAELWNLAKGLAFDFAVGAVLGAGGAGVARFAPNFIKLRAVGQSIANFRLFRLPTSVWRHTGSVAANKLRGLLIERSILSRPAAFLGRQIASFPVIDDYIIKGGQGIATSIKSLDLTARTYQSASNLRHALNKFAGPLQRLTTRTWGNFTVGNAVHPINDKVLIIAFEQGAATSAQAQVIRQFLRDAATRFPDVKIVLQFIP